MKGGIVSLEGDMRFLMKKFTVTFLTAMVFTVVSMLSCFSVSAVEQQVDMSITMEEYKELTDVPVVAANDIVIETDNKTYSFYNQLDENNQVAYDAMEASWLQPNSNRITFSLSEKISYETESTEISEWSDEQRKEFWGIVFATFQTGQVAFEYDYPEIFWYDKNKMQVSLGSSISYNFFKGVYTIKINKIHLTPAVKDVFGDEAVALDAQNFLIDSIEHFEVIGDDYYTKLKYMHDYIAKTVTYDLEAPYNDTAYGIFVDPYSIICEGYAEAMVLLCRKEGIPCISVIGNVKMDENMAHMWNYVMMEDGKWYAIDTTWDDLDKSDNPLKYEYFLKGSESFLPLHTPDNEYVTPGFVYPELSETDYVYDSDEPPVTTSVTETITTTSTVTSAEIQTEKSEITSTTETTTTKVTSTSIEKVTATIVTTTEEVITTTEPVDEIVKGDFNRNGYIDIGDIVALQKLIVKIIPIEASDYDYDLNNDNRINIWDYMILAKQVSIILEN